MSARVITTTTMVWLPQHYGPEELARANPAKICNMLQLYEPHGETFGDYVLVGTAEVTLTLVDESSLIDNKVDSLRAKKQKVMADAIAETTQIERQIQQLLAIANEVTQ